MKIKRFKNENGAVVVIVALSIIALMMVTALTIDVGLLYEERRHLQTVADAAALAGVQELPDDVDGAIDKAIEYALRCGVIINASDVEVSSTLAAPPLKDTIAVNAINPTAELYFARVIGISETQVVASAKAIVGAPQEYVGVVPWGIPEEEYEPGVEYVLKYGSGPVGGGPGGNFQPLGIDGTGGSEYRHDVIHGADTPLVVGDFVYTETGNMTGPTEQGTKTRVYDYNNFDMDLFGALATCTEEDGCELIKPDSQFIIIPIIPSLEEVYGHKEIEILAFSPFIITGIEDMTGDAEFGNGIAITGTFLNKALIISEGGIIPVEPGGIIVIRLID